MSKLTIQLPFFVLRNGETCDEEKEVMCSFIGSIEPDEPEVNYQGDILIDSASDDKGEEMDLSVFTASDVERIKLALWEAARDDALAKADYLADCYRDEMLDRRERGEE
jgi:hypothetical protein